MNTFKNRLDKFGKTRKLFLIGKQILLPGVEVKLVLFWTNGVPARKAHSLGGASSNSALIPRRALLSNRLLALGCRRKFCTEITVDY